MIAPAREAPGPTFSAGWQAAMAMPYQDAERLDPKTSFLSDAVMMAAARYAETADLAAATAAKLDMHG